MQSPFKNSIKIVEEKRFIKIVSEGERTDFKEVLLNAEKIHAAISDSDRTQILVDYRQVKFKMSNNDAFNLLKVFELKLTGFRMMKVAVIVNSETKAIGDFWSSICQKRGFDFQVFLEEPEAQVWLLSQH